MEFDLLYSYLSIFNDSENIITFNQNTMDRRNLSCVGSRHQRSAALQTKQRLRYTGLLVKMLKRNVAANPACGITGMDIDGLAISIENRQHKQNRGDILYSRAITRVTFKIEECTTKNQLYPMLEAVQRANNIMHTPMEVKPPATIVRQTATKVKPAATEVKPPANQAKECERTHSFTAKKLLESDTIVISDDSDDESHSTAERKFAPLKKILLVSTTTKQRRI